MPNKNTITIALVLTVAVIALAFGSQSSLTKKFFSIEQKAMAQSEKSKIPEYVLYDQVFQLTFDFKTKAELQQTNNEPITAFATYFKDKVQLTSQENEILTQVASEFIKEVQSIDDEIEELILELRKTALGDYVQPTPELIALQEERNELVLFYRSQLDSLLGSVKFSEFDNFVQGDFASRIQVKPFSSIPNSDELGGNK